MCFITLYHGSDQIVDRPELKKGKKNNDYGQGFYCTTHRDLACEWASKTDGKDGFVNEYRLDTSNLIMLDLRQYDILYWITMLLQHRTFVVTSEIGAAAMQYLSRHYSIDLSKFDLITGYRANDSYFSFARDFLNNTMSVRQLSQAMQLGNLGIQHVLISEKAFLQLTFIKADGVNAEIYHPLYKKRDCQARQQYRDSRENGVMLSDDTFILDLIRREQK